MYYKQHNFYFHPVKMSFTESDIPNKMFLNIKTAEILTIFTIASKYQNFRFKNF